MSLKILALDASGDSCSVACCHNASETTNFHLASADINEQFTISPCKHSIFLLDFVKQALAATKLNLTDLDVIAFTHGPGSFTGIRLAAGVVQGLAVAHNLPVIALSTLQVIAQRAYMEHQAEHALVALDAHTKEIYWGEYQISTEHYPHMAATKKDQLLKPESIQSAPAVLPENTWGVGNGWEIYGDTLRRQYLLDNSESSPPVISNLEQYCPRARYVLQLAMLAYNQGAAVSAVQALPVYLHETLFKTLAS